jgi:chromosome segregation ATPase
MPDTPDLDALLADYQKLQSDIATLQGKAAATQAQIKTAEAQVAEIAKSTDGYDKAGPAMQHELDDDEKAIARKRSIAELEVAGRKDQLDQKITEFDDALSEQAAAATAAADAVTQAGAAAEQAMQNVRKKQAAFADLKNQPKVMAAKLRELKGLLDETSKAEAQDDAVAMYFYVCEAAAVAKEIAIAAPDDYRTQLQTAQAAAEAAKAVATTKAADGDKAKAAATTARNAYETARASRRTVLLRLLREVQPPPAPP